MTTEDSQPLPQRKCKVCGAPFQPLRDSNILCKNKECKRLRGIQNKRDYRKAMSLRNRSRYRSSEGAIKITGEILYREEYVRTCPRCGGLHYTNEERYMPGYGECLSCNGLVRPERTVWNHNTARKL